jgi:hypothetical protein
MFALPGMKLHLDILQLVYLIALPIREISGKEHKCDTHEEKKNAKC